MIFVGTDLKFAIDITSDGFDMTRDDWTATVVCGKRKVVCQPDKGAFQGEDGKWYITFNTSDLGAGEYFLIVDIDVPDTDFPDNLRHEVIKLSNPILNVEKV